MLFPSFGQEKAQSLEPVKELMRAMHLAGKQSLGSIEQQLLLNELYDKTFGISQHSDPTRPLSLVAMQPKETVGPYSREHYLYRRFVNLNIGPIFHLSIEQFLQQPRDKVELMCKVATEKMAKDGKTQETQNKALERIMHNRTDGTTVP